VPAPFAQTLRALAADRPGRSIATTILIAAVLVAWSAWFTRARVAIHAVTPDARIEVEERAYAVDAPIEGRILRADPALGHEVASGDVLAEIDVGRERRQLDELQTRLGTIEPQAEAARRELDAQSRALGDDERATLAALDEGRARSNEARFAAAHADDERVRAVALLGAGAISPSEAERLSSEAAEKRAAAEAALLALETVQREQRTRGTQGIARIEALRRELASLDGQKQTTLAEIRVVEETIARSLVRAPIAGRVGEMAPVNAGMYVHAGDRLFSIVPGGDLRAVANFVPSDALGRVWPGQSARLRLEGFPWMQYGTVPATVTRVGSEVRDGRVRVELAIHPDPSSAIPMQHGLPAVAEVDVERVTPARLVLRAVGAALGRPSRPRQAGAQTGSER
jgi:multidrug resistance efflux pump